MSGSKKRGKGEHRSTQSSVKKDSGKSDKEEDFLMCSCGVSDLNEKTLLKASSAEEKKEASGKDGSVKTVETVQAAVLMVMNVEVPKESETSEKVKSKEDLIAEKMEDSATEEKVLSNKNSLVLEETIEEESASPLMTSNEYASMKERLNSTSFSEDNYRTPLLSPDLWPQENADEIHEALQKMHFEESSIKEPNQVEDWLRAEKSLEADWPQFANPVRFVEDIERHAIEEDENVEYAGAVDPRMHPSVPQPESTAYDRLTADMLMSVMESHRDAMTEQKILMARQTDAINRLAAAVEQQTQMISTLNENKVPRTF